MNRRAGPRALLRVSVKSRQCEIRNLHYLSSEFRSQVDGAEDLLETEFHMFQPPPN